MAGNVQACGRSYRVESTGEDSYDKAKERLSRKDVRLVHDCVRADKSELSIELVSVLNTPSRVFPGLRTKLRMRLWAVGQNGYGAELTDGTGGAWVGIAPIDAVTPVFGPHGCSPYDEEDWSLIATGTLPRRSYQSESDLRTEQTN